MNVLALDTCFGAVSVAVRRKSARGEWLLHEAYEERATGHAERLMPMIAEVLSMSGTGVPELDAIAVTTGPGTFTGMRIGVAAARGMALAAGLPVVAATSLAVMAHRADLLLGARREGRRIAVAVDARRGDVYLQLFGENVGEPLTEPAVVSPAAAAALIAEAPTVVVGTGASAVVAAAGNDSRATAMLPGLQPHARALALLAPALPRVDPVRPLYLRAPDVKPPTAPILRSEPVP